MSLPIQRVVLSHSLSEPAFGDRADQLFYARAVDGRRSLVRQTLATGLVETVTAEPTPAGSVGYGAGLFAVQGDTLVYAAKGGTLVGLDLRSGAQWTLTPEYPGVAAPTISPCGQYVAFLAESGERCNVLLVDIRGKTLPVKLSSDPWYAFNPSFAGDGRRIAWMEWDMADMPWDASRLVLATFAKPTARAAGSYQLLPTTSVTVSRPGAALSNPQYSPGGKFLAYLSDETGWRSLWVSEADGASPSKIDTGDGEIGGPDWVPGGARALWAPDGQSLYAVRRHRGQDTLLQISWPSRQVTAIETPFTELAALTVGRGGALAVVAAGPQQPAVVVTLEPNGRDTINRVSVPRASSAVGVLDRASLAQPELLTFATADGEATLVYHPAVGVEGPAPLIVAVHGGPTSESPLRWDAQAQYFATRGWGYAAVNHRGGTGYGRAFQEQLNGQWGVVDVQDARAAAEHLVGLGRADRARLVIMGGSAGGYTTLMALTQDPEFWAAGVSLFGIGDLYMLKQGSHRFEVNYEERLIGPLPAAGLLWRERSPLTHVKAVRRPVLLFHGKEDAAVPYQQSVDFAEAVRRQGGVAELVLYDDEGHGFVREANRRRTIEETERFLNRYVINQQAG
ncbi:MAG TPA: S9 family peptidase [Anaerolineales bacterium]|nr:S9 family peptidase [Anaerolineales bacterium]